MIKAGGKKWNTKHRPRTQNRSIHPPIQSFKSNLHITAHIVGSTTCSIISNYKIEFCFYCIQQSPIDYFSL